MKDIVKILPNFKKFNDYINNVKNNIKLTKSHNPKISVLLNKLNTDFNYEALALADNVYIPLKYFTNKKVTKYSS